MADKFKEVNQTPPASQPNTDDNRRRTRSQTRNGGLATTPTPVPESRGRKRASQSQPGSGNKRGRKSAQSSNSQANEEQDNSLSSTNKETELHSNQAENQDLSKQKPTETTEVSGTLKTDEKKETVDMESEETVKPPAKDDEKNNSKREAQLKASENDESPQDACKLKKPEPQQAVKVDDSVTSAQEKVEEVEKKEDSATAAQCAKTTTTCSLPKKAETKASGETKEESVLKTSDAPDAVVGEETQGVESKPVVEKPLPKDANESPKKEDKPLAEMKTTSEQPKDENVSDEKPNSEFESAESDKKAVSNEVEDKNEISAATEKQNKIQDSGDGKLDKANNDEAVKVDEKQVNDQAKSAAPV